MLYKASNGITYEAIPTSYRDYYEVMERMENGGHIYLRVYDSRDFFESVDDLAEWVEDMITTHLQD